MKKSMLLSFVTAGAIIATSVGTYALWDQMEAKTSDYTLKIGTPIEVAVTSTDFAANTVVEPGTAQVASMNFTPANLPSTKKGKVLLSVDDGTTLPKGVKVSFTDNTGSTAMPADGFTVDDSTQQTYKVKVEVEKNELTTQAEVDALKGKDLVFKVKAVLSVSDK